MLYILIAAIGYTLGNISSSYLVGKFAGNIDVRQHGSGNLGATNVFRVLGFKAGIIVFLADALKGSCYLDRLMDKRRYWWVGRRHSSRGRT